MKAHINVSSNQVMQKSTKISNTPTSSIHILMQIMQEIFQTGVLSHQQITSSMVPYLTGATRNNPIYIEAVPTKKQEQCTHACQIKIGPETYIYKLINPQDLHPRYTRITRQQLRDSWKKGSLPRPGLSASLSLINTDFISAIYFTWWMQDKKLNLLLLAQILMGEKSQRSY